MFFFREKKGLVENIKFHQVLRHLFGWLKDDALPAAVVAALVVKVLIFYRHNLFKNSGLHLKVFGCDSICARALIGPSSQIKPHPSP